MAWYSFLTSNKVVDNVLDKDNGLLAQVGSFIGNQNYTDEERAEAHTKSVESLSQFVKETLSESTVRSKTRRAIAIMWIRVELFLVLMTCIVAPFNMPLAVFYWSVASSELMFWSTMSILAFFFGAHMLRSRGANNILPPPPTNKSTK